MLERVDNRLSKKVKSNCAENEQKKCLLQFYPIAVDMSMLNELGG
jgi:hypothetical protein